MNRYPVGTAVSLDIPYVDENGEAVTPTGVSYTVTNEAGDVVAGPTAVAGPFGESLAITIAGPLNTPAGARNVEVEITSAAGVSHINAAYQCVNANSRLVVLTNSFQTLLQAKLIANDMIGMTGWSAASDSNAISALMQAYDRLTRMAYRVNRTSFPDDQSIYSSSTDARITPLMWTVMTPELFANYPAHFRAALAKAQVIEANSLMVTDPIGDKRRAGLSRWRVGESSMNFKEGLKPIEIGITREALESIRPYLDFRMSLARVS